MEPIHLQIGKDENPCKSILRCEDDKNESDFCKNNTNVLKR